MALSAFIVKIELPDASDKTLTSDEIKEELSAAGLDVKSVAPWSSPGEASSQAAGLLSNTSPNPGTGLSLPGLGHTNL